MRRTVRQLQLNRWATYLVVSRLGVAFRGAALPTDPPEPVPQYIIELVANGQTSDHESRCYIAPS